MPGIGIAARMRNTMRAPRTKRTRERRVSSSMTSFTFRTNALHICLYNTASGLFYRRTHGSCYRDSFYREFLRDSAAADYLDARRPAACRKRQTLRERGLRHVGGCIKQFRDTRERNRQGAQTVPHHGASAILAVSAALRDLFDDVAKFGALLATRARVLPFCAAAGGLSAGARLAASDSAL